MLAMLASVLLYTSANLCVKLLSELGTFQLVFLRSVVSLSLCVMYLKAKGIPLLGNNRRWLALRGVAGMVALSMFFHTVRHIPLATATVIQYLSPMFTLMLAVGVLGERARPWQWGLLVTALVGIVMVKGFDPRVSWGMWAMGLGASVLAAVAYLATMKCRDTDHPVGVVIWFHLLAVPTMGGLSAASWVPMASWQWGLALAVGVLSIAAQVLMTLALHREDAGTVMPFKYVGAVLALVAGWWGFGESMTVWSLVGMAVVVASVVANTLLKAKESRVAPTRKPALGES